MFSLYLTLFFFFFSVVSLQHYNMVMAAAASASEDHDLLLSRFLPYGSSQLFLDPPSTPVSSNLPPINVNGSSTGSSLVSSSSLRESLGHPPAPHPNSESAPMSAIYGSVPDVISLDWPRTEPLYGKLTEETSKHWEENGTCRMTEGCFCKRW